MAIRLGSVSNEEIKAQRRMALRANNSMSKGLTGLFTPLVECKKGIGPNLFMKVGANDSVKCQWIRIRKSGCFQIQIDAL